MPKKVDNFFVGQPLDPAGGGLDPQGPPRPPRPPKPLGYFGMPIMNSSKPLLPPNRPYHHPLDYPKYVKDSDPDAHVKVFKVAIRANGETNDAEINNLFSSTFRDVVSD
jgi:hypothetical protein